MKSEKATFTGAGGDALAARLESPAGEVRAYALFAHCFTCSKDIFAASRIAAALASNGIATLRFDFTGLGASGGDFANTDFSSNVGDLIAAADWLRAERAAPSILIGHSLGGAAVLAAAGAVEEAAGVVTIGAPSDPDHVAHLFRDDIAAIERDGEAEVTIAGRPFRIRRQFLDDIQGQRLRDRVAALRKALLVMHAPLDRTVGIDNAAEIFQAARHPKSFISLDSADHLLTRREDAVYAAEVVAAWASRFLPPEREPAAESEAGAVVVAENGIGPFGQDIAAGGHRLRAGGAGGGGRPPAAGRRAGIGGRSRPGPDALPAAVVGARHLHRDDAPHVRRTQAMAAGARQRHRAPGEDPRLRLRRVRHPGRQDRLLRARDRAGWTAGSGTARKAAGNSRQMPGAQDPAPGGAGDDDAALRSGMKLSGTLFKPFRSFEFCIVTAPTATSIGARGDEGPATRCLRPGR